MGNLIERFDLFCKEVCEESRFFYSEQTKTFLEDFYNYITDESKDFVKHLTSGSFFYRARSHDFISTNNAYITTPFTPIDMKPIPNIRANGRLNAYNINALYLSYDKGTAISEVRASAEAPVSVARFKTNKDLKVVRLSPGAPDWYSYFFDKLVLTLCHRFSQPLDNPHHQSREYIPTQIISEFLKTKGIDGIEYPSQFTSFNEADIKDEPIDKLSKLESRFNLCLFDVGSADCDPSSIEVLQLSKRINIISKFTND